MRFSAEILPSERNRFGRAQKEFELMEKAKKCEFFVPPTENVRRYHCNMGDGREGDCWLYAGRATVCRYFKDRRRVAKVIAALKGLTEAERKEVFKEFPEARNYNKPEKRSWWAHPFEVKHGR